MQSGKKSSYMGGFFYLYEEITRQTCSAKSNTTRRIRNYSPHQRYGGGKKEMIGVKEVLWCENDIRVHLYHKYTLYQPRVFFVTCRKRRQIQQNAPTNLAKRNTDMAFSKTMCHQCRCVCLCRTTIASLRSFSETSKNWVFSYRNLLKYINFRVCIEYQKRYGKCSSWGGGDAWFQKKVIANPKTERKLYHNVVFV